ncbi:flavin reductase family protein [Microbacterium karelineae]|uniref:flavin reductase family protein n=1 Tax=Microbacterium karelineae TaxID=2654283 RepID=UPI0012EAFCB1|nr:flavin reductase family protein [Microbacterium karelineae]
MQENALGLVDGFKAVFRDHPLAVTLITAVTPDGPVGLTASSVSSVAIDPPALSFSVTRATGTAGALLGAAALQVHFLTPDHLDTAEQFARSGGERFVDGQGWSIDVDGAPRLAGARARLSGRIIDTVAVGGSVLVVAEVTGVEAGEAGDPLLYVDRRFHRFDPEHAAL